MRTVYVMELSAAERKHLQQVVAAGQGAALTLTHAHLLLKADTGPAGPAWQDERIADVLSVSGSTVGRVRRRYATVGLEAALHRRRPRRMYRLQLDGEQEAHLVALGCSAPPTGRKR
jgi:hypothetical protein